MYDVFEYYVYVCIYLYTYCICNVRMHIHSNNEGTSRFQGKTTWVVDCRVVFGIRIRHLNAIFLNTPYAITPAHVWRSETHASRAVFTHHTHTRYLSHLLSWGLFTALEVCHRLWWRVHARSSVINSNTNTSSSSIHILVFISTAKFYLCIKICSYMYVIPSHERLLHWRW